MAIKNNTRAELMKFKEGDKVAIFNRISGAEAYRGVIVTIWNDIITRCGAPERYAVIKTKDGQQRTNFLCTAKKVN